eukprot:Nk52_evm82s217 gene=Nk52_evmTU82s217
MHRQIKNQSIKRTVLPSLSFSSCTGPRMFSTSSSGCKGMKFLVAVDGSTISDKVIDYTIRLMKKEDKAFIVTAAEKLEQADVIYGIYDPIRATANLKPETKDAIKKINETYREHSQHVMDRHEAQLREGGVEYEMLMHQGTARAVILKMADELNVDFVVLGSRGLGALQRALKGSTSDFVLHNTDHNVIVVKD